jgi:hypothetical protein
MVYISVPIIITKHHDGKFTVHVQHYKNTRYAHYWNRTNWLKMTMSYCLICTGPSDRFLAFSALPLELFKLEIIIDYKHIENPPSLPLTIFSSIIEYGLKFHIPCIFIMLYMYSKFTVMMFCYYKWYWNINH